jgi:hypothetical protein
MLFLEEVLLVSTEREVVPATSTRQNHIGELHSTHQSHINGSTSQQVGKNRESA